MVRDDEAIYASCELGASKRAGGLFPIVLERQQLGAADVPRRRPSCGRCQPGGEHGLSSELVAGAPLNRIEEALERHSLVTDGGSSLLAGAARWLCVVVPVTAQPFDERQLVIGPLLTAFAVWALACAEARGHTALAVGGMAARHVADVLEKLDSAWPGGGRCVINADASPTRQPTVVEASGPERRTPPAELGVGRRRGRSRSGDDGSVPRGERERAVAAGPRPHRPCADAGRHVRTGCEISGRTDELRRRSPARRPRSG